MARWACLALNAAALGASLIGPMPAWSLIVGCFGFLAGPHAVALASFDEPEAERVQDTVGEEPSWWPDFERGFRRYARELAEERRRAG